MRGWMRSGRRSLRPRFRKKSELMRFCCSRGCDRVTMLGLCNRCSDEIVHRS